MAYNDSKGWLDDQADTIKTLIEIARVGGVSKVEFDNSRDALYYQQYISNVKHGLQIHYPHYADVATSIRTWRDNDYDNGRFIVSVGIPSGNYDKQRRGKSQRHRRLPPPSVQGRPPVQLRTAVPIVKTETPQAEMYNHDDPVTNDNVMGVMPPLLNIINMINAPGFSLNKADLGQHVAKALIESIADEWILDDNEITDDRVTKLRFLRRTSETP